MLGIPKRHRPGAVRPQHLRGKARARNVHRVAIPVCGGKAQNYIIVPLRECNHDSTNVAVVSWPVRVAGFRRMGISVPVSVTPLIT